MHQKRLSSFVLLISSALNTKKISITNIGRGLDLPIQERSCIRRSDRFVGNKNLHREVEDIYKQFTLSIIGMKMRPKILVDWSQAPNTKNHILRAALAGDGRSLTFYEEVHEEKYLNNPKVEIKFLSTLKKLLPEKCNPIIITDAGFRNLWFKKILSLGWDYIGRVRGTPCCFDGEKWISCKDLLSKATIGFRYIGKKLLCKTNSLNTYLYLIKQKPKGRKSTRRKPGGKRDELNYKRSGKEAWLLASSLPGDSYIKIQRIEKAYKLRMQIEQGFRDIKSPNFGFGLRNAFSRDPKRIQILLLIAMIAIWIAWCIGYYLERNKIHWEFQSNSLKSRRVISFVYLGCRAIDRKIILPHLSFIWAELSARI